MVSVILTTHNHADFVADAIASLVAQTYPVLEILISDDASSDDTVPRARAVVEAYRGPHRLILRAEATNQGLVRHFNRCVAATTGSIIVEADGDDVSMPERVALSVEALADGAAAVSTNVNMIDRHGVAGPERLPRPPRISVDPLDEVVRDLEAWVIGATLAFDRRIYDVFGPLPEYLDVQDWVIPLRARLLGGMAYLEEPLVGYRRHGANMTLMTDHGRRADLTSVESWRGAYGKEAQRHLGFLRSCLADLATWDDLVPAEHPQTMALASDVRERLAVLELRCEMFARPPRLRRLVLWARLWPVRHVFPHEVRSWVRFFVAPRIYLWRQRRYQRLAASS
jgi:glycosyltransferase involved in cell wall biosynthesis